MPWLTPALHEAPRLEELAPHHSRDRLGRGCAEPGECSLLVSSNYGWFNIYRVGARGLPALQLVSGGPGGGTEERQASWHSESWLARPTWADAATLGSLGRKRSLV